MKCKNKNNPFQGTTNTYLGNIDRIYDEINIKRYCPTGNVNKGAMLLIFPACRAKICASKDKVDLE